MPTLKYGDRNLNYETYGSRRRLPGRPTIVGLANEYRTIQDGFGEFYSGFGDDIDIVLLENTNMGASTRLDRPLTPDEAVAEVEFFCKELDIHFPLFVGYCGIVELGFLSAQRFERSGVIMFSPMMRTADGHFVEHLYSIFKRAILSRDAQLISDILMVVDPHSLEHRANRMFPMIERHGATLALKDAEFFWLQTQQNKPVGDWKWADLPNFNHPVLVVRGNDDGMQIDSLIKANFVQPYHKVAVVQSSHRILDNNPVEVRKHISSFMTTCVEWQCESETV